GGEHHHAAFGVHAYILRLPGVLAAGVAADAGQDLLIVAFNKSQAAFGVGTHHGEHVVGIDSAVGVGALPGLAGVVAVFVALQPDLGFGKQIGAPGVVPMHVGDDDIGDVLRLESQRGDSLRGFD